MIVGGFFDGSFALAAIPLPVAAALSVAGVILFAGAVAGLLARRRRDRQLDAIFGSAARRQPTPAEIDRWARAWDFPEDAA